MGNFNGKPIRFFLTSQEYVGIVVAAVETILSPSMADLSIAVFLPLN